MEACWGVSLFFSSDIDKAVREADIFFISVSDYFGWSPEPLLWSWGRWKLFGF